jgi:hypothetical protein
MVLRNARLLGTFCKVTALRPGADAAAAAPNLSEAVAVNQ